MLYILSILGIIFEVSLPFTANVLVVTLSFLVYLISLKDERNIVLLGLIAIILSLQSNNFFKIITILIISYYLLNFLFLHLAYKKSNILIFSLVQAGIYSLLSLNNLKLNYFLFNIVGFIVLNYIYIRVLKRKDKGIKG
jgi:hypothetical protein